MDVPNFEIMLNIVSVMRHVLANPERKILVHCHAGLGLSRLTKDVQGSLLLVIWYLQKACHQPMYFAFKIGYPIDSWKTSTINTNKKPNCICVPVWRIHQIFIRDIPWHRSEISKRSNSQ
jgi:hypothetical protein